MPTDKAAMDQLLVALAEITGQLRSWTEQIQEVINVVEKMPTELVSEAQHGNRGKKSNGIN